MALYALALGYSNGIAPLIMGFINQGQDWRWVFVRGIISNPRRMLTQTSTGARYSAQLHLLSSSSWAKRPSLHVQQATPTNPHSQSLGTSMPKTRIPRVTSKPHQVSYLVMAMTISQSYLESLTGAGYLLSLGLASLRRVDCSISCQHRSSSSPSPSRSSQAGCTGAISFGCPSSTPHSRSSSLMHHTICQPRLLALPSSRH